MLVVDTRTSTPTALTNPLMNIFIEAPLVGIWGSAVGAVSQASELASYSASPLRQCDAPFGVRLFDRIQKTLHISSARIEDLINVESRSAGHVLVKETSVVASFDRFEKGMLRHVAFESLSVKSDATGVARKMMILQRLLVREQLVVHLPELFLRAGGFRSFGSTQRMWMSPNRWEMTKDKAQIVAQKLPHFFDYWISASAVDALEVAILDQRHRRAWLAQHVVALVNRVL